MEWLNYHHLRNFWTVAEEGSLKKAGEKLCVSQSSISAQIAELQENFGTQLFRRCGRTKVLTETGQVAFRYAGEIFTLGREPVHAVQQRPTAQALRLYVGVLAEFEDLALMKVVAAEGRGFIVLPSVVAEEAVRRHGFRVLRPRLARAASADRTGSFGRATRPRYTGRRESR